MKIGLLLGKTYAEWGHVSDAVAVYDSLIKSYPEDFQGYLAKVYMESHILAPYSVERNLYEFLERIVIVAYET